MPQRRSGMSCYCVMHITRGGMVLPLSKCCLPRLIKAHQAKITAILLIGNIKGHSAISIPAHIPLLTKRYAFNVSEKAGHATPPIQIYPKPIQLQKQSLQINGISFCFYPIACRPAAYKTSLDTLSGLQYNKRRNRSLARRKLDGWNPSWCGFCNA